MDFTFAINNSCAKRSDKMQKDCCGDCSNCPCLYNKDYCLIYEDYIEEKDISYEFKIDRIY